MGSRQALAPLREPAFRNQYLAQATSVVGTTLSPVALSLGVLQLTGSTGTLGLILAAAVVPQVLLMLIGGVWADRLPRHGVMLWADVVRVGSQGTVGVLLLAGQIHLWAMVALQALTGTATAFFQPASTGLTATTVRPQFLQQANALLSLTRSVAGSVGPLAAGIMVATVGAGWALIVDALTFAGSAYFLSRLRVRDLASGRRESFVHELAAGFREVTSRAWVWTSIVGFMMLHLAFGASLVLGPAILLERDNGEVLWGAIIAATFAGNLLGDVLALHIRPQRLIFTGRLLQLLVLPHLAALAMGANSVLLVSTSAIAGIGMTFPDALWFTALQQHVPQDSLSRVSSYDWMGTFALRPIGNLLAPVGAALIGASATLGIATALVGIAYVASFLAPSVRNLRRLDEAVPTT